MKLNTFLLLNAIVFIAMGIILALYGPGMLAFFAAYHLAKDGMTYWLAASFARMFGCTLFGMGGLLFVLRDLGNAPAAQQRKTLAALAVGNFLTAVVAVAQQYAIWGTAAGWAIGGVFALLTIAYVIYLLKVQPS